MQEWRGEEGRGGLIHAMCDHGELKGEGGVRSGEGEGARAEGEGARMINHCTLSHPILTPSSPTPPSPTLPLPHVTFPSSQSVERCMPLFNGSIWRWL